MPTISKAEVTTGFADYVVRWFVSKGRSECGVWQTPVWNVDTERRYPTWKGEIYRHSTDPHDPWIARRESARKALRIGRSEKHQKRLYGTRQERRAVFDAIRAWLYEQKRAGKFTDDLAKIEDADGQADLKQLKAENERLRDMMDDVRWGCSTALGWLSKPDIEMSLTAGRLLILVVRTCDEALKGKAADDPS